jgi:hypothetical protein
MLRRSSLLLLLCSLSAVANAGRPLQSEDAGLLERGRCEIEGVHALEATGGETTASGNSLQLGCAIGGLTQLALQGVRATVEGDAVQELGLVGKSALRPVSESRTGVAIAYELRRIRQPEAGDQWNTAIVKGVVSHPFDDWLLHANLGVRWRSTEHRSDTVWSLAVERTGLGPVDLTAEVFADDRSDPWINTGLRIPVVPERLFLDASRAVQTNAERPRFLTLGFKFAF